MGVLKYQALLGHYKSVVQPSQKNHNVVSSSLTYFFSMMDFIVTLFGSD
jgi:hypothetical protein